MRRTFLPGAAAALLVAAVVLALPAGAGAPAPASAAGPAAMDHTHHAHAPRATVDAQVQAQVLTWTANNSFTAYASTPSSATAGPTTIVFENSAATGNTTGMQHTLTFDTTTPGFNHDVNVNILADPFDGQGGRHQVDVVLTPGKYRYGCAIPGHGAMVGTLVVTDGGGDTTAPAVTAAVSGDRDPEGRYVGSATVTLTATDSGSGVARVEYSLDGGTFGTYSAPVTVTAPGAHTVTYRATDNAGNTSVPQSVSFTVVQRPAPDTTPPVVNAGVTGQQDHGDYVGSATVTLTATDTESGVDRIEYSLDAGSYTTYTAPVTVNVPGVHTVTYRATDKAGNTSVPQSVSFTVVLPPVPDTTPPVAAAQVTGERNADGAYVGTATVTVTATDTESGVDRIEYSLDGAPYAVYTAPVAVNQPGGHTVGYRAADKAGNTSTAGTVAFTVVQRPAPDTIPPVVTAGVTGERSADGAYVGTATVTVTATDTGSGVKSVEYAVDGGAFGAYTAPVTVTAPGAHTVRYRATDNAGNVSPVGSVSFTVVQRPAPDTTPPAVTASVTGERNATGDYVGSATVTLTATDSGSGVARIEYSLDGGPYAQYAAPVTVNQPGRHTVTHRATDNAGNTATPQSVSFTVVEPPAPDTTPPVVAASVSGQQDGNGDYVGSATVTVTATDQGSGVKRVEYALDGSAYRAYGGPVTVNTAGNHTLSYRATDNAGNTSSAGSVTFSVVPGGPGARCPVPDTRPTVWMGTFDSGVRNRVVRGGCTINNLIEDERTWATHGAFVRHVRTVADRLRCEGRITARERSRLIMAAARSGVGRPDPQGGYRSIFDGSAHSLHRWEHAGAGGFTLTRGGVLTSAGGPGLLWYPERAYQNFSLKLQWRDDAPGAGRADSGVSVRLGRAGDGVEVQLLDRAGGDPDKTGSIRGVDPVDLAGAHATPKGTWNDLEIRVSGRHYSVFRNGVLINEYVAPPGRYRLSGFIGLENHGPQDTVSFRNIRIAALAPTPDRGDNHG